MAGTSSLLQPGDVDSLLQSFGDRLDALEQTAILPVGLVAYCAGAVPNGWLALNGGTISAARYGQLVAYLGTTTLPDCQGRVVVGDAAAGTFAVLLSTGGVETVTLTALQSGVPVHTHPAGTTSIEDATHDHSYIATTGAGGLAGGGVPPHNGVPSINSAVGTQNQNHHHPFATPASIAAAASAAHSNLQPYIVLVPIIKF